jgi:hypothetical protein
MVTGLVERFEVVMRYDEVCKIDGRDFLHTKSVVSIFEEEMLK